MNISALHKLEKGWITLDWSKYLNRINLSQKNLADLVHTLDNWKSNRSCKEVVLIKYKSMPVYVTLKRSDFAKMGEWLMIKLTKLEMYEECSKLYSIKNKL
jgi:hypothetical protein